MKQLSLLLILFLVSTANVMAAPFVGTYVVGSGETYTTVQAVFQALSSEGVSGHTILKIRGGTYTANHVLNNIQGLGVDATLTIQSNNGNPASVKLTATSGRVMDLFNCSYVTIKNLTFNQPNATINMYVQNNNNVSIDNCIFNGYVLTSATNTTSYSNIYAYSNPQGSISVTNCELNDASTGAYFYNCPDANFSNNAINSQGNGINVGNCAGMIINSNLIKVFYQSLNLSNSTGIQVTQNNCTSTNSYAMYSGGLINAKNTRAKINNNVFVSYNSYAAYMNTLSYADFEHNTCRSETYRVGLYQRGNVNNCTYKNNLFSNISCGAKAQFSTNEMFNCEVDYNAYDNSNPNCTFIYISQQNFQDISECFNNTGYEEHGIVGFADFVEDTTKLIPRNGELANTCLPIAGITTDINGSTRNPSNPDPGAYEFNSSTTNDMKLSRLVSPSLPNCTNGGSIEVEIRNIGANSVSSCEIEYILNGDVNTYAHSSTIAPYTTTTATIGNVTFDGHDDSLQISITKVNNTTDPNTTNNMLPLIRVYEGFSGEFIVGDSADLSDLTSKMAEIQAGGICGDVVFKIKDGYFNGNFRLDLNGVKSSSDENTITFESLSGNRDALTIRSYNPYYGDQWYFYKTKNIIFKNFTINSNYNNCRQNINVSSNPGRFEMHNMRLIADSTFCTRAVYIGPTCDNLVVENCSFENGYAPMYVNGNMSKGVCEMNNNQFTQYRHQFYINNFNMMNFTGNLLQSNIPGNYGINVSNVEDLDFTNNIIRSDSSQNPLSISNCGMGQNPSYFRGNYIYNGNNLENSLPYSAYFGNCPSLIVANNTFNMDIPLVNGPAVNIANNNACKEFINNIVVNPATDGIAVMAYNGNNIKMDFNNYQADAAVRYNNSDLNLSDWVDISGQDKNSMDVDPMFHGDKDQHVCNALLNGKGTSTALPADIDGDSRGSGSPDIGADEFSPAGSGDFMVTESADLCNGSATLVASPGATSYMWSTGATTQSIVVATTGSYTVDVTGVCNVSGSDSVTVGDNNLAANFVFANDFGKSIGLRNTSVGSPTSYHWDFGDGNTSTETHPSHIYATTGEYTITLTVTNECGTSTYSAMNGAYNVGISEVTNNIKVYPNPTSGSVTIDASDFMSGTVTVTDLVGKTLHSSAILDRKVTLDLSSYENGMYLITVENATQKSSVRIIKN